MGCCLAKEPVNEPKHEKGYTPQKPARRRDFDAVDAVAKEEAKKESTVIVARPPEAEVEKRETSWDRLHKGVPTVPTQRKEERENLQTETESEDKTEEEAVTQEPRTKPLRRVKKAPKSFASTTKVRPVARQEIKQPPKKLSSTVNGNNRKSVAPKKKEPKEAKLLKDLSEDEKKIASEILDTSPGVTFDQIAGLKKVKETLYEIIVAPSLNPALFTGLRTPAKGVLLFGPPGNGKTMLAKAVATECNATFFNISASSITSKFVGESEKQVRSLFSAARKLQPSVIFIDEIDSMLTSRKSSEHDASRRLKTEFLVQMDGAGSNADDRILILGATNRPFELDDAALRRMPKRVYIPLPDKETRKGLIASKLKGEKATLDISALLQITEGYSGSDLASLCSEAAMYPLRDIPQSKMATADPSTVRAITLEDFKAASKVIRPSVKPETMRQCIEWGKAFGVN
eukprot:TRINITY_DN1271_c0_g1_i2.p1 TRINITY_DN1271_c0_g1~~TRINITY_DN1271_c0_g1_i2.p1  ORF type:complete len:468 (+),score=136.47 TRINITY_DN1271_c0_g1_i2:28-1404(+)